MTSFFRPEQYFSTPARLLLLLLMLLLLLNSTAAEAAGAATGANMAWLNSPLLTALAQQPVVDSLAAAFREGIAITPPAIPHPSSVRQQ